MSILVHAATHQFKATTQKTGPELIAKIFLDTRQFWARLGLSGAFCLGLLQSCFELDTLSLRQRRLGMSAGVEMGG